MREELSAMDARTESTAHDAAPQKLSLGHVEETLAEAFNLEAQLTPLRSERDQLYLAVDAHARKYIVRIVSARLDGARLGLQTAALGMIEGIDPTVPVPHVLDSANANKIEYRTWKGEDYCFSLFSFLDGIPVSDAPRSELQRRNVGAALARLDLALRPCAHSAGSDILLWDMLHALRTRPFAEAIESEALCNRVVAVLEEFEKRSLPVLNSLPHQLIHNDFHPGNVLVDRTDLTTVTGIIDFGDIVRAPRVIDLAVAVARHSSQQDPITDGAQIVAGYHAQSALSEPEIDILYNLACTRLAMRVSIWSWRLARGDARADVRTIQHAADSLAMFENAGRDAAARAFRDACPAN